MQNQPITLELNVDAVNVILAALSKAPYEAVADLIANVRQQAMGQLQAAQQAEPEAAGGTD